MAAAEHDDERLVSVSIRLRGDQAARLDAIAAAEELTRTDVLRRLLRAGLAEHDRTTKGRP